MDRCACARSFHFTISTALTLLFMLSLCDVVYVKMTLKKTSHGTQQSPLLSSFHRLRVPSHDRQTGCRPFIYIHTTPPLPHHRQGTIDLTLAPPPSHTPTKNPHRVRNFTTPQSINAHPARTPTQTPLLLWLCVRDSLQHCL